MIFNLVSLIYSLVDLKGKVAAGTEALEYFTSNSWAFSANNMVSLLGKMNNTDRRVSVISIHIHSIRHLNLTFSLQTAVQCGCQRSELGQANWDQLPGSQRVLSQRGHEQNEKMSTISHGVSQSLRSFNFHLQLGSNHFYFILSANPALTTLLNWR